jgi:hypothetical protein
MLLFEVHDDSLIELTDISGVSLLLLQTGTTTGAADQSVM